MEIFLPTLHTFENNNIFTGSCGLLRFRIAPTVVMATPKEVDLAASSIHAELWHGELCYELSEMEQERTFPIPLKFFISFSFSHPTIFCIFAPKAKVNCIPA
mgnify:CR=1 FL=1